MNPIARARAAAARFLADRRPPPLRVQLLALLALVSAASSTLLVQGSRARLEQATLEQNGLQAQAVARAAAGIAAPRLAPAAEAQPLPGMEAEMRELAALPGVGTLQVADRDGRPVLTLVHDADGRVMRQAAPGADAGPPGPQAWAPIGAGGSLGSVRVGFDGSGSVSMQRLRDDAVLAIVASGLLAVLVAYAFASRSVAPLQPLARFARELAAGGGGPVRVRGSSREIAELTEALNEASATLHAHRAATRAQEAAREAILNAVPDVLIGLTEDCKVHLVNPGIAAVFGRQPEDALGLPLQALLPGIDAAEAEQRTLQGLYMRSTRTHVARFEIDACRNDGTPFPAEVSLSRIETADGPRYAALVRDLTEQRMTFSLVRLYARALECTTNGVVISDMTVPGHPVFYANPAFYRITGYEPGEAIGRNCAFLQREDTAQPEIEELRAAVRESRPAQVVLRNYRKDGTLFFNELSISPVLEADGPVRHYVGVLHDVTERERTRMAIAERSARLNAVFDLSPDGFVVFDRDGVLVYCNHAFLAMTGWPGGLDLQGLSIDEFEARFDALCDPAQERRPLADALAAGDRDTPRADTLHLLRPERRVLARMARSQRSGHVETILFFRDVTRETEVDRMKSEFLTTAAHELRTPMVSVFGFTELLLNRPVGEERRRDMLETIHRQAGLLIHMVNELLDLARIEARQGKDIRREMVSVGRLVDAALEPMRIGPRGGDLVVDLADGAALLNVDPDKTRQALTNVLSNAVKYSPQGGPILVTTQRGELRGRPAVGVRIADRGIGMSPEQAARVFERFYRADPSGNIPGTGLGMSLVKEIVELHDGRVELASETGRGTAVTLWWPLEAVAPAQPAVAGEPAGA